MLSVHALFSNRISHEASDLGLKKFEGGNNMNADKHPM